MFHGLDPSQDSDSALLDRLRLLQCDRHILVVHAGRWRPLRSAMGELYDFADKAGNILPSAASAFYEPTEAAVAQRFRDSVHVTWPKCVYEDQRLRRILRHGITRRFSVSEDTLRAITQALTRPSVLMKLHRRGAESLEQKGFRLFEQKGFRLSKQPKKGAPITVQTEFLRFRVPRKRDQPEVIKVILELFRDRAVELTEGSRHLPGRQQSGTVHVVKRQ